MARATRASSWVHPRARDRTKGFDHDLDLEVSSGSGARYLTWIAETCAPYLGRDVLEVGAGIGSITERISSGRRVVAVEQSVKSLGALRKRFDGRPDVLVVEGDLTAMQFDRLFDSVLLVNVLEHIEHDARALTHLASFLRPGGRIVIYVPALNGLYGDWDYRIGHFRRYDKDLMRRVVADAGLDLDVLRYQNMMGVAAWAAFSRLPRRTELRAPSGALRAWDQWVVPLNRRLEAIVVPPIGLNIFAVATLPAGGS